VVAPRAEPQVEEKKTQKDSIDLSPFCFILEFYFFPFCFICGNCLLFLHHRPSKHLSLCPDSEKILEVVTNDIKIF